MAWAKLDDGFWSHPKVVGAGNEAAGAYVRMLSYCAKHLTDGKVPEEVAKFITKPSVMQKLEEYSFLIRNGSGFLIPDYLDFNPSREEKEEERKARAEAGRKGGLASGQARAKQ